jgi:hypothetical protein
MIGATGGASGTHPTFVCLLRVGHRDSNRESNADARGHIVHGNADRHADHGSDGYHASLHARQIGKEGSVSTRWLANLRGPPGPLQNIPHPCCIADTAKSVAAGVIGIRRTR